MCVSLPALICIVLSVTSTSVPVQEVDLLLHHQREAVFRKNQELQALRLKEKDMVSEVSGSKTTIANLDSRTRKVDQNTLKQQEIIYNQASPPTHQACVPLRTLLKTLHMRH